MADTRRHLEDAGNDVAALVKRMARLASALAVTEDRVAEVYEQLARTRPDAASRLRATALEARNAARHQRDQEQRLTDLRA